MTDTPLIEVNFTAYLKQNTHIEKQRGSNEREIVLEAVVEMFDSASDVFDGGWRCDGADESTVSR